MKPRLFISHASHHEPPNQRVIDVRDHLYEVLSADWDVFLEKQKVAPGQKWRAEVLASLAAAQAAVILFDTYAANVSRWVPAEALVLCFKRSLDPRFQLVPVFFKGVDANATSLGRYEPFGLTETLALTDDESLAPDALARTIAGRFKALSAGAAIPQRGWVADVVERLTDRQSSLSRAAAQLDIDAQELIAQPASWVSVCPVIRHALGQRLHEHPRLSDCLGAIGDLMDPMTGEERAKFAQYLFAKWVPNEAVETLLNCARNPRKRGLLALNSSDAEIFGYYASRTRIEMKPTLVHVVSVADAVGDDDESMFQATSRSLKQSLFKKRMLLDDAGRELGIADAVSSLLASGDRSVLCSLPRRFARSSVLERLRGDFPGIIFLLTGEMNDLQAMTAAGAQALKPALDARLINELALLESGLEPIVQ